MKNLASAAKPVTDCVVKPATSKGVRKTRALGIAAGFGAMLLASTSALAIDQTFGEFELTIDPTLTAGASMRVDKRFCQNVSLANGGCTNGGGWSRSINQDNGNLNFDQGDFVGANVKALVDISANYKEFGGFLRARAFYDQIYTANNMDFVKLTHDAQQRLNSRLQALDAYVYWNSDVADIPFSLRAGKQVINWGESLFLTGGINQFGTVDVASLRQAGSEVKEALKAVPYLFASFNPVPLITVEGFWQFAYANTELDPSGSYFEVDDNIGPGAVPLLFLPPDDPKNPTPPFLVQTDDRNEGTTMSQFGVAARYYADWLNQGTELGFYYTHYNARILYFNYVVDGAGNTNYRYFYPGDINVWGASFNTVVDGTAFAGELSFAPNMPFAVNSADQLAQTPLGASLGLTTTLPSVGLGQATTPYIEGDLINGQFNTISLLSTSNPVTSLIGADSMTLITNPGFTWAPSLGERKPINRLGAEKGTIFQGTQYATEFSWGYVLQASADYNNVVGPWTLTPSISWRQDVMGYSPGNVGANWLANTKQVTFGVQAAYLSDWEVDLAYTAYMGNPARNQNIDRDFVSFSVSRAF